MAEAGQQQALPTVPASAVTGLCDDFLNSDAGRQLQDNIRRRVSRRAKTVLTLHEQRACVSVADALRVLGSSFSANDIMKDAKAFVDRSLRELEPISSRVEREARFACELHRQMPPAVPAASSTTVDPASSKTGYHQEGFAATEQRPSPADNMSKLSKADRSSDRPSSTSLQVTTTDSRSSGPSTSVNQTEAQALHLSARASSAARVSNPASAVETPSDRRPDKTHEEAKPTQTNTDVHKSAGSNSTTTGDDGLSSEPPALNPETAAQLLLKQLGAAPQQKHGSGPQRSTQLGSTEATRPPHNETSGSGRAHPTTKDADFDQDQQHPSDDVDSMSDTDVSSVHTSDLSSWSDSDHDDTTQEDPKPTSAQPPVAMDMEQDHAAPGAKTGTSGSSRTRSRRPSKRKNTGQKGNDSDPPSKKRTKRAVKRTEEKDATAMRSRPRRAAAQGVEKATAKLRDAERDERNDRRRASRRSSRRSRGSQEQSPPPAAAAVIVETTVQADVSGSSNHEQNNDQSNVPTDVSNDQRLRRSGRRRAARTSSS